MQKFFSLVAAIIATSFAFAQVTERPMIYQVPEMAKVQVTRGIEYRKMNDTSLKFDVYYPPAFNKKSKLPVVVFNNGAGGMELPQWRGYSDWAKLIAANGMIAILHQTRPNRTTAIEDCGAVLDYVKAHAAELHIDGDRMAIWTSSANTPRGTRLALKPGRDYIRALVMYYGGPDSLGQMRQDVPILVVRAALDAQFLNIGIDNFIQAALIQDARLEVINYLNGIHAFDIMDHSDEAKSVIKRTIEFLKRNLENPVPVAKELTLTNRNFMWMMHTGQSKEAIAAFRKAVVRYRADSTFNGFWNGVIREDILNANAYYLLRNGKPSEALEAFKLIVETYPNSPNAHDSLGDAYEALGNKSEALSEAEKTLQLLDATTDMNEQTKARIKKSAEEKIKRLK